MKWLKRFAAVVVVSLLAGCTASAMPARHHHVAAITRTTTPTTTRTTQPPTTTTRLPTCPAAGINASTPKCACPPGESMVFATSTNGGCVNENVAPTTLPPTTTTTPTTLRGPIGPPSGQVEYVCSDGSGSGGSGGAAIAAVQDGQGNWQCPSNRFFNLWTVEVGGSFYCTTDHNGNAYDSAPYYKATIGNFTMDGLPGTYYGAYCTEPGEDALFTTP